jgi:6-methylpretetramide 4-monooxygenase / 4-hydroxy-6-methylpretetramide 12a-monooxygenase
MGDSAEASVLVIGAGPAGLFAAVELARHGVHARIVEREPHPHHQARATALQPGTLEILQQAGVLGRVLPACEHLAFARIYRVGAASLTCVSELAFSGVGCEWEFEGSLPQWRTEQVLADRLAELGGEVERGVSVVSLTEQTDGVLIGLQAADGKRQQIAASWVIGAGGAHSPTRESIAEPLTGSTYPGTALVADIQLRTDLPRDGSALVATPAGYVLLAPLPGGRWLTFVGDLDDGEVALADGDTADAVLATVARRIPPAVLQIDDVAWASTFRMHRRLVPRLADSRRFLLGDAGHLSSPFGGEGLNSGLHDAHNLGWKLALDLRGHARPGLLDSFAWERHTADQHVLEVSDRLHQLAHEAVESARSGSAPSAPPSPEAIAALARARLMLDVSYQGSPLVGEWVAPDTPPLPSPVPGDRYPGRASLPGTRHQAVVFGDAAEADVAALRTRWHGMVDVSRGAGDPRDHGLVTEGVVLIRPDGYLGFRAVPADHAAFGALDSHLGSYLVPASG